jgi:hypothetical protein
MWIGSLSFAIYSQAATFTVTTTNTFHVKGQLWLGEAIIASGVTPGAPHRIEFAIAPLDGTVKTILLTNLLPSITQPTIIDGYTQPGSRTNSLANGDNAVLLIELAGTNAGLGISASGCTIRGLIIGGSSGAGIFLDADQSRNITSNNVIAGNFIGVDATGTNARPNNAGVQIAPASTTNSIIGGTTTDARNIISGNTVHGVDVDYGPNLIIGNFIGTDRSGTSALGNLFGVSIGGCSNNVVGGISPGARNVISGNSKNGVTVELFSTGNRMQGNFIGTDVTGTRMLPNGFHGVMLDTATNNLIGGTTPGAGNVISGNAFNGVVIVANNGPSSEGAANVIQGNLIGTDFSGRQILGNGAHGVHIFTPSNLVGGQLAGAGNVISGNAVNGLLIDGSTSPADLNQIQGNFVGADKTGTQSLGNVGAGVFVKSASGTVIGGSAGNTIAFNGDAGVVIAGGASASNNVIRFNRIFSNSGLGIDLGANGVTTNDPCDTDNGPNHLQNFPILTGATNRVGSTTISGILDSSANTDFTIDFYANIDCDASGFGEGNFYLGSTTVATDGSCHASFTATLPASDLQNQFVTATATDANGNTSEFSPCQTVVIGPLPTLSVILSSSDLQISWPDALIGWTPESTTNLNLPIVWVPITNQPADDGNFNTLTVQTNELQKARFFRLIHP